LSTIRSPDRPEAIRIMAVGISSNLRTIQRGRH
jgi:hypothetical protein